jgi:KAP family P-loop domain
MAVGSGQAGDDSTAPPYEKFTVLLDDPSDAPMLGFDIYADVFAQIVERSKPQFALGVFGDWGSGKTTLMRAIEQQVKTKPDIMLPVWFNAWRYEREDHLVIPLLDHLREAILEWGNAQGDGASQRVEKAAALFARASRALLRGLAIKGGLPGIEATLAFEKVLDADGASDRPDSFYHAAFLDMREATRDFVGANERRIVVFVDDLDRCLPLNALQVLESMKLFFDVPGFVFVVGLDQGIIERAIEAKYRAGGPSQPAQVVVEPSSPAPDYPGANGDGRPSTGTHLRRSEQLPPVSGAEYIKKLFQVPFSLPRLGTNQLSELIQAITDSREMSSAQSQVLRREVQPHLEYMSDRYTLNPRDVKRLINEYIVQMKLLHRRLGPRADSGTVLAIQLMRFRGDWHPLYEVLLDDPDGFVHETRQALAQPEVARFTVGDEDEPVPHSFMTYVRERGAVLLEQNSLSAYLLSAEQTGSTNTGPRLAGEAVRHLRKIFAGLGITPGNEDLSPATTEITQLREALYGPSSSSRGSYASQALTSEAITLTDRLEHAMKAINGKQPQPAQLAALRECQEILELISQVVREMRSRTSVAA